MERSETSSSLALIEGAKDAKGEDAVVDFPKPAKGSPAAV